MEMYNITSKFYNLFDDVDTYYVCMDPKLGSDFLIDGDLLWIRGSESLVPGVLQKTIDAILRFDLTKYDFIVRSNSSTVIDFYQFLGCVPVLLDKKVNYLCVNKINVARLDPLCGIHDSKYFGLNYASGTMIVMSREAAVNMIAKRHFLDYAVIDDVAIGAFFKYIFPCDLFSFEKSRYALNEIALPLDNRIILLDFMAKVNPIAWRNKSKNRSDDVKSIEYICNLIEKSQWEI
jgi:hypothetical protein